MYNWNYYTQKEVMGMVKRKEVTFNLFRPFIKEYQGRQNLKNERFDFNKLLSYMINNTGNFATKYKDEQIVIYNIRHENFEEGLYHIKVVKFRTYDLPNIYTPIDNANERIIEEEINENEILEPLFNEEGLETDGNSTIGESLSVLYDSYNNTLVIQSNQHCTSIIGLTMLFSSILQKIIDNGEIDIEPTYKDSDFILSLAPIISQKEFEDINNLETVTEIEYVYEDNDMQANVNEYIDFDNQLQAGKITTKYYVDSKNDRAKTLNLNQIGNYLSWFRKDQNKFKKMKVKGRPSLESNIETFELINGRLNFKVIFKYDHGNVQLNSQQVYNQMERKYLGNNYEEGFREQANY